MSSVTEHPPTFTMSAGRFQRPTAGMRARERVAALRAAVKRLTAEMKERRDQLVIVKTTLRTALRQLEAQRKREED